jgi:hypothetical protein
MVFLFFLTFCFDVRLFTVVVGEKSSLGEKSSQKKPSTHVHVKREREREKNEPSGKKIDSAAGQSFSGESSRGDENERGDFVARNRRE